MRIYPIPQTITILGEDLRSPDLSLTNQLSVVQSSVMYVQRATLVTRSGRNDDPRVKTINEEFIGSWEDLVERITPSVLFVDTYITELPASHT